MPCQSVLLERPRQTTYIVRDYIGVSYKKYSRTSFIRFYYITEALNLRPFYFTIKTRYRCHAYLVCKEYW
jgi:hypothetical protein